MARTRPTASNDRPLRSGVDAVRPISDISDGPLLTRLQGSRPDRDGALLTRAEAHALRAGASRTHHQLTQHLKVLRDPRLRSV